MSLALSNVLSAGADFAINSYLSPKYANLDRFRAPGEPAPAFFSIWTPVFAGRIGYGLLDESERSDEAALWNHVVAATGFTYAWALANKRFYTMQAAMAAMTFATFKYRKALPEGDSLQSKAVRFTAEMGLGWLAAADMLIGAKNAARANGRAYSHREQDAVGLAEVAVASAAGVAGRIAGWKGVSAAAAWALAGIAVNKRSEKHVRAMAGVAAAGVVVDLASGVWRDWNAMTSASDDAVRETELANREAAKALAGDQDIAEGDQDIDGLVEIDVIPTADGYVVEETITALRH